MNWQIISRECRIQNTLPKSCFFHLYKAGLREPMDQSFKIVSPAMFMILMKNVTDDIHRSRQTGRKRFGKTEVGKSVRIIPGIRPQKAACVRDDDS